MYEQLSYHGDANMTKLLNVTKNLTFSGSLRDKIYRLLMKEKQQGKINQTEWKREAKVLELVHSDVGKLFSTIIYEEIYCSLLRDNLTGVVWIYLMKTKVEVPAKYQILKA